MITNRYFSQYQRIFLIQRIYIYCFLLKYLSTLTSENSTSTRKLKITLKDEDGNVLSTGYLDQRVGPSILNTGYYAVARLNPNENIITDPITINVPQSAPYKVIIEAAIENTYNRENRVRSCNTT